MGICLLNIPWWGNGQERREEQPEGCGGRCERYDNCKKPRDRKHHETYCMDEGKDCSDVYRPTTEERRMDI